MSLTQASAYVYRRRRQTPASADAEGHTRMTRHATQDLPIQQSQTPLRLQPAANNLLYEVGAGQSADAIRLANADPGFNSSGINSSSYRYPPPIHHVRCNSPGRQGQQPPNSFNTQATQQTYRGGGRPQSNAYFDVGRASHTISQEHHTAFGQTQGNTNGQWSYPHPGLDNHQPHNRPYPPYSTAPYPPQVPQLPSHATLQQFAPHAQPRHLSQSPSYQTAPMHAHHISRSHSQAESSQGMDMQRTVSQNHGFPMQRTNAARPSNYISQQHDIVEGSIIPAYWTQAEPQDNLSHFDDASMLTPPAEEQAEEQPEEDEDDREGTTVESLREHLAARELILANAQGQNVNIYGLRMPWSQCGGISRDTEPSRVQHECELCKTSYSSPKDKNRCRVRGLVRLVQFCKEKNLLSLQQLVVEEIPKIVCLACGTHFTRKDNRRRHWKGCKGRQQSTSPKVRGQRTYRKVTEGSTSARLAAGSSSASTAHLSRSPSDPRRPLSRNTILTTSYGSETGLSSFSVAPVETDVEWEGGGSDIIYFSDCDTPDLSIDELIQFSS